ncbi:hypothetical protein ACE6H2_010748 [Prunus campanulata]
MAYKILVEIWVSPGYPTSPSRPHRTMDDQNTTTIKLHHPYVDARSGGFINVPHMLDWHSERTLVVLTHPYGLGQGLTTAIFTATAATTTTAVASYARKTEVRARGREA